MSVVFPQPEGALITMKSGFRVDFGVSMVQSLTRTDGVLSRPPRRFILSNKRREFYQKPHSPATAMWEDWSDPSSHQGIVPSGYSLH